MRTRLRLFPLNAVLFPGAVLNLHVFEPRYKQMISECLEAGENFGVVLIREGREAGDPSVEPHQIGSVAEIVEVSQLPFGRYYLSTIGRGRFRIVEIVSREPYLTVEAELLEDTAGSDAECAQVQENVREAFMEYAELLVQFSGQQNNVDLPADAQSMSYVVADGLQVADVIKQRLLEVDNSKQRLRAELGVLQRLLPQLHELLQRREEELAARRERGEDEEHRNEQERYFGKYFSVN